MKNMYPVEKYMSKTPHTIGEDIALSKAMEMMREYRVRHLPVQSNAKLIGVLSDRDIKLALTVHPAAKDLKVGDIMTEDPYSVSPNCPLEEVTGEMAKNKLGCAVIVNNDGRAIGIFTAVDGLGLMSEWLRKKTFADPEFHLKMA